MNTTKLNLRQSGFVDEDVGSTDSFIWAQLVPKNFRGPGIFFANRRASFPAFKPQGYNVGRDPECDLVIDDPYVSNRHCLIYRVARNGQLCVFLRDLSSNGTFVNKAVVGCNQVVELKDRDEITIVDSAQFWFLRANIIYRTFAEQYTLLNFLGKGHIGKVFGCQESTTGQRFAVKKHNFSPVPNSDQGTKESIAAGLNLMGLCHRNIIFMKEAFEDNSSSSHVTQIAEKGGLFDLIVRKSKLSEDETRYIFKQLFDAVKYLHERNIVHRDLKPENILIVDEENSIVICSFDLSITIQPGSFDTTLCGTPNYVAPEILTDDRHRKYGREVDIWSLGVILYICLCGFPPFSEELYSRDFPFKLGQQITSGRFDYPSPYWDSVGDVALDLIDSMLVVDPEDRLNIDQCLVHPWITQAASRQETLAKPAPVLRRKPTMLGARQVAPLPTYSASLKDLQRLNQRYSPPDPTIMTSKTMGKVKISNPLLKDSKTYKQGRSEYQNIYGEPRYGNPEMTKGIGNDIGRLNLGRTISENTSQKAMHFQALEKAHTAIQLDKARDIHGALSAYRKTCHWLHQVLLRTAGHEDREKLEAIRKTYANRIQELAQVLLRQAGDGETLPQGLTPAAWGPQHSQKASVIQSNMNEFVGSESEATTPTRDLIETVVPLEYDPFARLVNSAISKPMSSQIFSTCIGSPEDLQDDMEFNDRGHELSTWTCTPSEDVPFDGIPLRVDGHPVVLPVKFTYPLTAMFSSPPDPHPLFISPSAQLSDEDVNHIFSTFPTCLGFYLLVNGFLQVMMPGDFNYEEGIASLPSEFGGLKVSLIPETVCPTAGEASASSPATTTTSTRTRFERMFGQSSTQTAMTGPANTHSANAVGVSVGCAIRAIVPGSKSKQRFEGKTGVAITPTNDNSKKYITIPTHLLTDAVIASKTTSLNSDAWKKDVKVCVASNSVELGEVTDTFDEDPKSFPVGFSHDVSLVDISGIPDGRRTIPYAPDLTWLSQQEWMEIKYNSNNLVLLDDRSREAKSIGVVDSRCQMVGQGIFRIQQQSRKRSSFLGSLSSGSSSSRAQDPRDDPSTWTTLVARSILYRVQPDYPARGGQSGVPVCVVSESTDGTTPRSVKVAGFASFVQMVSDVQKYDLEGDKLYKRLQEGRVAFYGAFQVPQELREGYQIL